MSTSGRPKDYKTIKRVRELKSKGVKNADIARAIGKSRQLTQYFVHKYCA